MARTGCSSSAPRAPGLPLDELPRAHRAGGARPRGGPPARRHRAAGAAHRRLRPAREGRSRANRCANVSPMAAEGTSRLTSAARGSAWCCARRRARPGQRAAARERGRGAHPGSRRRRSCSTCAGSSSSTRPACGRSSRRTSAPRSRADIRARPRPRAGPAADEHDPRGRASEDHRLPRGDPPLAWPGRRAGKSLLGRARACTCAQTGSTNDRARELARPGRRTARSSRPPRRAPAADARAGAGRRPRTARC